jgi:hypothetical protein
MVKPVALAAGFLLAGLGFGTAPAHAGTLSGCSPVVPYGKQICLNVDAASPSTVTATLVVQSSGRGWYGKVEIDGPHGKLVRTGDKELGAPARWPVSHAGDGQGQYCAIDWRWDVYHQDYFEENHYCLTS